MSSPVGLSDVAAVVRADVPAALATVIAGPGVGAKLLCTAEGIDGTLGHPDLDRVVSRDLEALLAAGPSGVRRYGDHGEARESGVEVFFEVFAPAPQMVIFGAVDFTVALAANAKLLGYRVTVCDARGVFATEARFPMADEVVVDWPDRWLAAHGATLTARDAVCVLTHDAKFDVPAIVGSLATAAGYIGVMGSRRTHGDRLERLRAAGVEQDGITRLCAPIGLDLGARTPEEAAVSICAEIIARRTGRSGGSLADGAGPIH